MKLRHVYLGAAVLAVMVTLGFSANARQASAEPCGPSRHTWKATLPSYGIRDYSVSFCGDETLDVYAGAWWKGNKDISVAVIEPDGTQHLFHEGGSRAGGALEGPLDAGTWTIVVRNGNPSRASFQAELSFE